MMKQKESHQALEEAPILPFDSFSDTSRSFSLEPSEQFLRRVFAKGPEDTDWSNVMHRVADSKHPDLPAVFRRIATTVPHTEETAMSFFYCAAAEEFVRHGMTSMLPEVAGGIRRLDENTYDPDAVAHLEDILLAEGFEAEALCVAEYFLAPYRADDGLTPWAVPDRCNLIFELRVGRRLRAEPPVDKSPEQIAAELRVGIETEIHPDAANMAAAIICGIRPEPNWTRALFNLVTGDLRDDNAWREYLGLSGALMHVEREAWRLDHDVVAGGYRGLMQLVRSEDESTAGRKKKGPRQRLNLLDYLQPAQLEGRIAQSCPEIMGINPAPAQILLRACGVLTRFCGRHELLSTAEAAEIEGELMFLHGKLAVPDEELPVDEEFKVEIVPEGEWHSDADQFKISKSKEKTWARRNWRTWLMEHLTFPFQAVREDGDDSDLFGSRSGQHKFLVGDTLEVQRLDGEEGRWGIQVVVRHGKQTGGVPLADLSVRPKSDPNFKIVLEYAVAVANEYVDLG